MADIIPWTFNFGATQGLNPTLLADYKAAMGIDGYLYEHLNYDIVNVNAPERTGSTFIAGSIPLESNGIDPKDYYDMASLPKGFFDAWGIYNIPWEMDPTFEVFINPLKNANSLKTIEAYPVPIVDEDALADVRRQAGEIRDQDKMSSIYCGSLYEWCGVLRGQEAFMMDLCDEPEFAEALVEKVSGVTLSMCLAAVHNGVDVVACYDDFGMQTGLQISPQHWRRYIKPGWKRIWDAVRKASPSVIIFLHSCGGIEGIIPDLIEIGLDVLHPIQPETMDVYKVCAKYQEDIAIWGTVSCQQTMPLGTPGDIDQEIKERVQRIGSRGGFVLSPANVLGPEVPLENVTAFIQAARKYAEG